jgi:hypothetical protein
MKILAHSAATAKANPTPPQVGDAIQTAAQDPARVMRGHFVLHKSALAKEDSREKRTEMKRSFLPDYYPYVAGVLEADAGGDDPILMTIMVWALDVGEFDIAFTIAVYAKKHGLSMPEGFNSKVPGFVLETIADAVLDDPSPDAVTALQAALDAFGDDSMPDEAKAKAHKAMAQILDTDDDPDADTEAMHRTALAHYRRAYALHKGSGVKTALNKLAKKLGEDTV